MAHQNMAECGLLSVGVFMLRIRASEPQRISPCCVLSPEQTRRINQDKNRASGCRPPSIPFDMLLVSLDTFFA